MTPDSEQVEVPIEDVKKYGFWKQVDQWLGRRHRIYYFFTGLGIGIVSFWYVFVPVTLDQVRKQYDSTIVGYTRGIDNLQTNVITLKSLNEALEDSVATLNSIGYELNRITIPLVHVDADNYTASDVPLFGSLIYLSQIFKEGVVYKIIIYIDTCNGRNDDSEECPRVRTDTEIGFHQSAPIYARDQEYLLRCADSSNSSVTLTLHRIFK
jgi:hypothetical protein